jgi:hypothetical protein
MKQGNVIETHEHTGDFKEWQAFARMASLQHFERDRVQEKRRNPYIFR